MDDESEAYTLTSKLVTPRQKEPMTPEEQQFWDDAMALVAQEGIPCSDYEHQSNSSEIELRTGEEAPLPPSE